MLQDLFARHRKLVVVIVAIALLWLNRHSGITPQEMILYVDATIQLLTLAGVYQARNES